MDSLPRIEQVVLVALLMPLAWTALIGLLHRAGRAAPLDARMETHVLVAMLVPSAGALGALLVAAWPSAPVLPQPWPAFGAGITPSAVAERAASGVDALRCAAWLAGGAYLAGSLFMTLGLLRAGRAARRALCAAQPAPQFGDEVRVGDTPGAPYTGVCGRILLPRRIVAALTRAQLDLIVAHERAHLARGDHRRFVRLAWIDVLLWHDPSVRGQLRRCRLAAELACDDAVVRSHPHMRKAYAATVVAALKHAAGNAPHCVPAAFSTHRLGDHGMRIEHIMRPARSAGKRPRGWACLAAALLALPVGTLQLAYADADGEPRTAFAALPLIGEVVSGYGEARDPISGEARFHAGVDIVSAAGSEVLAPGNARVVRAIRDFGAYGHFVELDHGDGLITRYAHLQDFSVAHGDRVVAGQPFAQVGLSGRANGKPHLYLEVIEDGLRIDPATVFDLPGR